MVFNDAAFCEHCGQQIARSVPVKQIFSNAWEELDGLATKFFSILVGLVAAIVGGLIFLAIAAGVIYVLVAFVKWCWEHS